MSADGRDAGRPIFAAEGFVKRFGETEVLRAAAVRARRGRVTVLLGRNGSGKSTLLRCALGLLPADNGSVIWRGRATLRPRLGRMAREGLFFLPSGPLAVPRTRGAAHMEVLRAAFRRAAGAPMEDPLEVASFVDSRTRQLSGGERRRVELTLALRSMPACLIADEPLVGLAPLHQGAAVRALRELARGGAAVVATGHDVELLRILADEVVWIVAGGTRVLGTPEEAWAHPEFARHYLGHRRHIPAPSLPPAATPRDSAASLHSAPAGFVHRTWAWLRRVRRVWLPLAASVALIWAVIRTMVALVRGLAPLAADGAPAASPFPTGPSVVLVAACVFLAWVDQRRRGDALWLADLGVEPRATLFVRLGTCLGLETLLAWTASGVR